MSVKKSFSSAEIPDEEDQRSDRFNPEDEQDPDEKKDEKEEDEDEAEGEEEVKPEEAEEVVEEEKEDDDADADEDEEVAEEDEEEEDFKERSPSLISEDQSLFMEIDLGEIRKDVQCPICLGIIKKTRTVMECLHRFCRECIDKSMRLGNNECPACRKHCASRRSLRDDPKFDALIAALFTNIDSYEEEELAFHEDEKARNKQIQASIAQISQRQSEALVKRRSFGKEAAVLMRSQRIASGSRRRRNCRNMEQQNTSEAHNDDNNDDNNNNGRDKDSSSDERGTEVRQRKRRKRSTSRSAQHPSSSGANNNNNGNCADNDTEVNRDSKTPGLVWNPEILAWGRGGTRSNTRHGNNTPGGSSKSVRNARVNRLVEYLRNILDGNNVEVGIHLKLVSLDTKCIPDLPQPYLCCRPTLLVKQLREFVALQMHLKTEEVELLVTRGGDAQAVENPPVATSASAAASKDDLSVATSASAAASKDDLPVATSASAAASKDDLPVATSASAAASKDDLSVVTSASAAASKDDLPVVTLASAAASKDDLSVATSASAAASKDDLPVATSAAASKDDLPVATSASAAASKDDLPVATSASAAASKDDLPVVTSASAAASKDEVQSLEDNETLSKLKVDFISSHEQHLIIAYRPKQTE